MKKSIIIFVTFVFIICLFVFGVFITTKQKQEIQNLKSEIQQQNNLIRELNKKQNETDKKRLSEEEKFIQKCLNENYTTIGMSDCMYKAIDKWNKKIDKNLLLLKNTLSEDDYKLLKISQQKWIEYKNSQWQLFESVLNKQTGTIYHNILSADKADLVKQRADMLNGLYFELKK